MKIKNRLVLLRAFFICLAAVFAVSCGKKNVKAPAAAQTVEETPAFDTDGDLAEQESSLRGKGYSPDPELAAIRFDFDKAELGEEARGTLRANAAALKKRAGAEIQVAGHCDERGTTEYNLALGQRRANAVRNYYKYLGVKMSRMSTISYGEERPVCGEAGEECWGRNRRAETLLKIK